MLAGSAHGRVDGLTGRSKTALDSLGVEILSYGTIAIDARLVCHV